MTNEVLDRAVISRVAVQGGWEYTVTFPGSTPVVQLCDTYREAKAAARTCPGGYTISWFRNSTGNRWH
jgi:hypothetical protein